MPSAEVFAGNGDEEGCVSFAVCDNDGRWGFVRKQPEIKSEYYHMRRAAETRGVDEISVQKM